MRREKITSFQIVCGVFAVIALLLIGSNIGVIAFRGAKSIPECILRPETRFAIALSLKSACISTCCCFVLSLPTAYLLTRGKLFGRGAIEMLLELTMGLPYIVIGLSLLIVFSSPFGRTLKELGFPVVFSANGVIIAQLVVNLPFAIMLVSSAFREVDQKLERVAGLLGAKPLQQFCTILLPLCKKSLISAVILVWSRALGEFGATLMLVGVTRMKTETLPGSIYLDVSTNNLSGALASAFILLLISAVSLGIANGVMRMNRKRSRYE